MLVPDNCGACFCTTRVRVYADCIFTDWRGATSPIIVAHEGVANIVNTVFRNFNLVVGLVDVAWGGIVRFENVSLAEVHLESEEIVCTQLTDYTEVPNEYGDAVYLPEDDSAFDVVPTPLPPNERGPYRAEFLIEEAVMSDCVYLKQKDLMPGCPPEARQARQAIIDRGRANPTVDYYAENAPGAAASVALVGPIQHSSARQKKMLTAEAPWFVLTRQVRLPVCVRRSHRPPACSCPRGVLPD